MANESDLKYDGTQILLADHATDFGSAPATAANSLIIGSPTDYQLDLTSLTASGGARESAKIDFGDPRASMYILGACIEFASAPNDGDVVDFFLAGSPSATAATGNPANLTGADAAFTDTTGSLAQMQYVGSLTCRNNVLNISTQLGVFRPSYRYGILVVVNNADQAIAATMDETHITMTPLAYVPGA